MTKLREKFEPRINEIRKQMTLAIAIADGRAPGNIDRARGEIVAYASTIELLTDILVGIDTALDESTVKLKQKIAQLEGSKAVLPDIDYAPSYVATQPIHFIDKTTVRKIFAGHAVLFKRIEPDGRALLKLGDTSFYSEKDVLDNYIRSGALVPGKEPLH